MTQIFAQMTTQLARYRERTDSRFDLALFRSIYLAGISVELLLDRLNDYQFITGQYKPVLGFDYFRPLMLGVPVFFWIKYLNLGILFYSMLGRRYSRATLAFSSIGMFFLMAPLVAFSDAAKLSNVCITLLALAVMPGIEKPFWKCDSEERVPIWQKDFLVLIVAMGYLQAAISKVLGSGLLWLNGEALAGHMRYAYLFNDQLSTLTLGTHPTASMCAAILVLVFESLFISAVFLKGLRPFFAAAGVLFHLLVWFFMRISFFKYYIWSYFIFVEWNDIRVTRRLRKWLLSDCAKPL